MIQVEDLRKSYGDTIAVDGITFTAGPGRIFGLLGPNGAGKTTTIDCIAGVHRPTGGRILVGVLFTSAISALGGCWWPIEVTPTWMQKLAWLFPTGWVMDAIHRLTSFGDPASAILPHAFLLTVATAILLIIGRKVFRFY